jgi:hypothetical protein
MIPPGILNSAGVPLISGRQSIPVAAGECSGKR